jgi:ABC-2 type transport system permease protein
MRIVSPTLLAQIVKEFLSVLRDPRTRLMLIVPPLAQLLIFSFAATLDVRNVTVAVLDRDGGRWSQELVADLKAASFVGRVLAVGSRDALDAALDRRQALLAIDLPDTFSRDLAAGRRAPMQVLVDGRRANAGQIALSYVDAVAARVGARASGTTPVDAVAVRHWFNPNLVYRWFIVPSLSGILSMIVALVITALSIARERELGTFDQLLVSPTTPTEIVIAKTVPALVIGTVLGNVMVAAGAALFGIPFTGSYGLLLVAMILFILSVVGIGLMISSICTTQQQAILGSFAAAVPMILMSGFATPVENMPLALQWASDAIPLKHFLIIAQGTFLKALPAGDVFAHLWPMAAIASVTLPVAAIFVKSRLQ